MRKTLKFELIFDKVIEILKDVYLNLWGGFIVNKEQKNINDLLKLKWF